MAPARAGNRSKRDFTSNFSQNRTCRSLFMQLLSFNNTNTSHPNEKTVSAHRPPHRIRGSCLFNRHKSIPKMPILSAFPGFIHRSNPIYIFSICQSIGSAPFAFRNSLHWLKCRQPKKPRYADNGLGCGAFKIRCFGFVSIGILLCAGRPQSR